MGDLTKDFDSSEFASLDGAAMPERLEPNLLELAQNLQVLRDLIGRPIIIHSGYRSPAYNRAKGGASDSRHLVAQAADFSVSGRSFASVYCATSALIDAGKMKQGGLGYYAGHIHYDVRGTEARWNEVPLPDCPAVPIHPPPRPEPVPPPKEGNLNEAEERVAQVFAQATLIATHGQPLPEDLRRQIEYLVTGR